MAESFHHVGRRVEFGEVQISADEADRVRAAALKGARLRTLDRDLLQQDDGTLSGPDSHTFVWATSYATGVLSDAAADYSVDEIAYTAKSTYAANFWRVRMIFARYNLEHAEMQFYNDYEVESYGGAVLVATRRVRVIRQMGYMAFNADGEPYTGMPSFERKAFEKPMIPEDIDRIEERVDRVMRRQQATAI